MLYDNNVFMFSVNRISNNNNDFVLYYVNNCMTIVHIVNCFKCKIYNIIMT